MDTRDLYHLQCLTTSKLRVILDTSGHSLSLSPPLPASQLIALAASLPLQQKRKNTKAAQKTSGLVFAIDIVHKCTALHGEMAIRPSAHGPAAFRSYQMSRQLLTSASCSTLHAQRGLALPCPALPCPARPVCPIPQPPFSGPSPWWNPAGSLIRGRPNLSTSS